MGIEAIASGLFSVASAGIQAAGAKSAAAANAAAQSSLNRETMDFNAIEASKARDWSTAEAQQERRFSHDEAIIARQFNAEQVLAAREYEERMANSAHQREVNDLKSAGLNPILSATGGNGSAVPVSPILASPSASAGAAPSGSSASVSGLKAPQKTNYLGAFVNTAMEGMRLDNDLKRAKADVVRADAEFMNSQTNAKRQAQDALESMERITNIKSDTELKKIQGMTETERVNLYKEQILSEVQERINKKNISDATVYNLTKCAEAAATAAGAQASMAALQSEIQHAESPERIAKLQKEANYYQSLFDKNKWIMQDPKEAARRSWWKQNPEAAHANEMLDIVGNVVHGNVSFHGGN